MKDSYVLRDILSRTKFRSFAPLCLLDPSYFILTQCTNFTLFLLLLCELFSNVNAQLGRLSEKCTRFTELLRTTDTANNPEFNVLRKGLLKDIRVTEKDLAGLKQAIDVVNTNRARFPLITDNELNSRREFVVNSASQITGIKAKVDSESARDKMAQDEARARQSFEIDSSSNPGNAVQKDNSRFIKNQVAEQRYMLGEQDHALDGLGAAVDRLGEISKEVNTELKEQNLLLNQLDDDLDSAGNRMGLVQTKLAKLLKTKDGCTIWTIVILTLIFVALLAMVIYT